MRDDFDEEQKVQTIDPFHVFLYPYSAFAELSPPLPQGIEAGNFLEVGATQVSFNPAQACASTGVYLSKYHIIMPP